MAERKGLRRGWFKVLGQDGDRSPEEQMLGLGPALEFAQGKSVLDLGCAEGWITKEFAAHGASRVLGIDLLSGHIDVARQVCRGHTQVELLCESLQPYIRERPNPEQFDVVLALGIAHKFDDPGELLTWACKSARTLLVFRGPGKEGMFWDGNLRSKHSKLTVCHVPSLMAEQGFREGETLSSARGERAQYWWREDGGAL